MVNGYLQSNNAMPYQLKDARQMWSEALRSCLAYPKAEMFNYQVTSRLPHALVE